MMLAVIFEFTPNGDSREEYLEVAASLAARLKEIDGFISIERFLSLTDPDKVLSLSFFRDEEALQAWRNLEEHRAAQARGRAELFLGYRLRVASVIRDYSLTDRAEAPDDSKSAHGG